MSDHLLTYGKDSVRWEQDARTLRDLIEEAGMTQMAAAAALDLPERAMRGCVSGREPVPRAVLYAMRWVVQHRPNKQRYLQVHWKRLSMEVKRTDGFIIDFFEGGEALIRVNGVETLRGKLDELERRGLVSIHSSYSNDRFLLPPSFTN